MSSLKHPKLTALTAILGVAVIGTALLLGTHAATPVGNIEAENGTLSGNASVVSNANASGGKAVKFSAGSGQCTLSAIDEPSCGALWGAFVPGTNQLFTLEGKVGRTFAIFQSYNYFNSTQSQATIPSPQSVTYMNGKQRILFATLVSKAGTNNSIDISWADIANGDWDTNLIAQANSIKALAPTKIFLAFDSEMETAAHASNGTPAQYVAAYQHIHDLMIAHGATNIIWAWDAQGSFKASVISQYYPGDNYIDWIGWDPYNHAGTCTDPTSPAKGWKTNYSTFNEFYSLLEGGGLASVTTGGGGSKAASKPFVLGEYGSVEADGTNGLANDPSLAATWYSSIPSNLQTSFPNIKALMMWDSGDAGAKCVSSVNGPSGGDNPPRDDSTQTTLDAFKAAGLDPYVDHTY